MRRMVVSRFLRDLLTDEQDDFDLIGVSMFLITLTFIAMGMYDLLATHAESRELLARRDGMSASLPRFDLQGWAVGAAALLGGHGINALSRRGRTAPDENGDSEHE